MFTPLLHSLRWRHCLAIVLVSCLTTSFLFASSPKKIDPPEVTTTVFTVRGTVTDDVSGAGVPGVNVLVKGTSVGTITDVTGTYSLNAPDANDTLQITSIGYMTQQGFLIKNR